MIPAFDGVQIELQRLEIEAETFEPEQKNSRQIERQMGAAEKQRFPGSSWSYQWKGVSGHAFA